MFRYRRLFTSLVAGVIILSLLVACAPAPTPTAKATVPTPTPVPPTPTPKPLKFGFLIPTVENPFWVNCSGFAEEAARALGIDLIVENFHNREDEELADLEALIARGIDGLLLVPQTGEIGPALLRMAEGAGIKVIGIDRWPEVEPGDPEYPGYFAFIGPNDEKAGYGIAKALAEHGVTKMFSINLFHGASVTEDRAAGMRRGAQEFGIQILAEDWGAPVGETREWGVIRTENYLSRFPGPGFNGVWNVCDETAMGVVKIVQERGLGDQILVGGMDMIPDAMQAVKDGTYLFTTGGHWLQGGFAVVMLFDYFHGVEPTETIVKIDLIGVTSENVDDVAEGLIPFPPEFDFKAISRYYNPEVETHFDIAALVK